MVIIHQENVSQEKFKGTVIDLETIGPFCRVYTDSRQYKDIRSVIFGAITKDSLKIYCAKSPASMGKLEDIINDELDVMPRPFFAFNTHFETGVIFHSMNREIIFDGELQERKYEAKRNAVAALKIPQHDDPFYDDGLKCSKAWQNGDLAAAVRHNRSCLLKERDILLKRGYRSPEALTLTKI
jgi:hypothetical protein